MQARPPIGRARVGGGVGIDSTPAAQPILPPRRGPDAERDFQQPPSAPPAAPVDRFGPSGPAGGRSGFGDTGQSCVKIHEPAGGRSAMGTSFGWSNEDARGGGGGVSSHSQSRQQLGGVGGPTAGSAGLGPGAYVLYRSKATCVYLNLPINIRLLPCKRDQGW